MMTLDPCKISDPNKYLKIFIHLSPKYLFKSIFLKTKYRIRYFFFQNGFYHSALESFAAAIIKIVLNTS